jgi:hypothetical protein
VHGETMRVNDNINKKLGPLVSLFIRRYQVSSLTDESTTAAANTSQLHSIR